MRSFAIVPALLASVALARTDISGCTTTIQGQMAIYYVPDTGELCEFLNCGGGRAPPKTDVPGCPLYSGTATYSPKYLAGFTPKATSAAATSADAPSPTAVAPKTTAPASLDISIQADASLSIGSSSPSSSDAAADAAADAAGDAAAAGALGAQGDSNAHATVTSAVATATGTSPAKTLITTSHGTAATTGAAGAIKTTAGTRTSTAASGTKSPLAASGAAAKPAQFWMGSAALLGLGAVAVAL